MRSRAVTALTGALALAIVSGCASGDATRSASRTVTYWLWDANQLPAYETCAQDFEKRNPGLDVRITQMGWNDYWTKLTASFIAGTQPDVFTDHISKFAQFADLKVLAPLDELPYTNKIEDSDYQPGLASAWTGQDGHRYGAPKDWDTVALFYNKEMAREAGLSPEELNNLTWNPEDGGTFEKAIARLTVDENGRRGDEKGFDPRRVKVYGLATNDAGDSDGQTHWSSFAASTGWHYTDKKTWGTRYNYDDPRFKETIDWYFGLAKKGYLPPQKDFSETNGPEVQFGSGTAATALHGSWMIQTYYGFKGVDAATARTPVGPTGKRATMMNGLADSITRNARNKEGAAKWVAHLASADCQRTVGRSGVVFPATKDGTDTAVRAYAEDGIDVDAFTEPVAEKATFPFPITDFGADVHGLMRPAMQDIYANDAPVDTLDRTNDQINLLLSQ
ncbi:ABC transporter substrate-binding protein [Streptomyces luteolus]|uniref:Sugar ABC transporter substrate-binding protein n=1 Tax=Streptomyces luteolus TaxID=3043615 RepID=A0ABT6STV1_9ACTN|nr:sugar ABC transporter substrate-binding protein [Streptomyces sp. B-S-A12]MDI3419042.1 sugar ABC transporter substrate-binding protein [Streptomyces sp. B-S-A12]